MVFIVLKFTISVLSLQSNGSQKAFLPSQREELRHYNGTFGFSLVQGKKSGAFKGSGEMESFIPNRCIVQDRGGREGGAG